MEFSTNSAMASSGFDCDRAMISIAFFYLNSSFFPSALESPLSISPPCFPPPLYTVENQTS